MIYLIHVYIATDVSFFFLTKVSLTNLVDMVTVVYSYTAHNCLTIIPRARVGYEMIDSQRGA